MSLARSQLGSQPVVGFFQSERSLSLTQHTLELFLWVCMDGFGLVSASLAYREMVQGKSCFVRFTLLPQVRLGKGDALYEVGFPGSARIPPSVASRAWRRPVLGSRGRSRTPQHRNSHGYTTPTTVYAHHLLQLSIECYSGSSVQSLARAHQTPAYVRATGAALHRSSRLNYLHL